MYRKFRNVPIFKDFPHIWPYFLGFRSGSYVAHLCESDPPPPPPPRNSYQQLLSSVYLYLAPVYLPPKVPEALLLWVVCLSVHLRCC